MLRGQQRFMRAVNVEEPEERRSESSGVDAVTCPVDELLLEKKVETFKEGGL
jgi:hypothetical protein